MSRLLLVNAVEMEEYLFSMGFLKLRTRGSHSFYRHSDGRYTTIPFHNSRDLPRPLIRSILRQIKVDTTSYNNFFQT